MKLSEEFKSVCVRERERERDRDRDRKIQTGRQRDNILEEREKEKERVSQKFEERSAKIIFCHLFKSFQKQASTHQVRLIFLIILMVFHMEIG